MDANPQCTTQPTSRESAATRQHHARILEQAQRIGFWWQSSRRVAQQLGVPDSSFRYCCQQHQQRCEYVV